MQGLKIKQGFGWPTHLKSLPLTSKDLESNKKRKNMETKSRDKINNCINFFFKENLRFTY